MTIEERVRAALQYLGYSDARINEILAALGQQDTASPSTSTTSASTAAPPVPPAPAPLNDVFTADAAHAVNQTFVFTAQTASGNDIIKNFDNISGDGSSSDRVDLRAVFDALGGKFTDGVNDFADRQAALHIAVGDFDGDSARDDAKLTIDGLSNFSLAFLNPTAVGGTAFDIKADPVGNFADIVIGGGSSAPTQSSPTPVPQPIPTSTGSTPTPSTPPPSPSPSTSNGGLFQGKFPAHWERLDNGVNIERTEIGRVTDAQLKYLHDIGVENIRIFMKPGEYVTPGQAINPATNSAFQATINFMHRANDAGLAVVFSPLGGDYFAGFTSNPNDQANINMNMAWWREMATYIGKNFSPQDVFLEIYNEPFMSAGQAAWWKIAGQLATAVRQAAPDFTIIVPSNGYNNGHWSFIDTLAMSAPLPLENVVYNVHYYNPMNFTHQGASWVSGFANIVNRHYSSDGVNSEGGYSAAKIQSEFATASAWAQKYGVFVTVNEFGSTAPFNDERAAWMNDVRAAADKFDFGWDVWNLDKGVFGIVDNRGASVETVSDVFLRALTWGKYQDGDVDWRSLNQTAAGTDTSTTVTDPTNDPQHNTDNSSSTSTQNTSTSSSTPSTPQQQSPSTPLQIYADREYAFEEKFVLNAADLHRVVTIFDYDSLSNPNMINDQIDFRAIFTALGGKFTDGVNDFADRKAAVHVLQKDLDNKGGAYDTLITVDGAPEFALHLIHPAAPTTESYQLGNGSGAYDDILIA